MCGALSVSLFETAHSGASPRYACHIAMCVDMCVDMSADACLDMGVDVCIDMQGTARWSGLTIGVVDHT